MRSRHIRLMHGRAGRLPLALALGAALAAGCGTPAPEATRTPAPTAPAPTSSSVVALVNGRVYVSPDDPPIEGGTVLIDGGRITSVGRAADVTPPAGATIIDCAGQSVTAGFWNSHVHFTQQIWERAASAPAEQLSTHLDTMLTRHGFTSVMDTGSYLDLTQALRARIEKGEVRGPRILTAGEILFPPGGHPPAASPGGIERKMLEASTPEEAAAMATRKFDQGADALKLYMATWWQPRVHMPAPIAIAAAKVAHARGKLVLAHPTDRRGIDTALDAGVDIIVHTTPDSEVWDAALLARMNAQHVSIIPTLKLWREELARDNAPPAAIKAFQGRGVAELRVFAQAGGDVLFGTDVGYMADDDLREEIEQMGAAGLTARQILRSLTTAPAKKFGRTDAGRLSAGAEADVVVFAGNPDEDLLALTRVQRVLRAGKTVWTAPAGTK